MREPTIARNYAETLASLAERAGELDRWGTTITEIADSIEGDSRVANFLSSPKVNAKAKVEIITRAFQDRLPRLFVRFLGAVITNRRQHLIPQIASEYALLVDEIQGRVHARVTVSADPNDATRTSVEKPASVKVNWLLRSSSSGCSRSSVASSERRRSNSASEMIGAAST